MKRKEKKIKLYWFHSHFYNWMGGHKFIYEVIHRLKTKYNCEIILVTSGLSSAARRNFEKINVPIITLFGFSTNNAIYWIFLSIFLFLEKSYLLYIKKIDTSALFISSMFPTNILTNSLSKNTYQLCYEPFAFFYDKDFIAGFSFWEQLFIRYNSFLYKKFDADAVRKNKQVFTISHFNKKWINAAYKTNAGVIYAGVDTNFFKPTKNRKIEKKYLGKKVLFHSTDYTHIKGTKHLIEALPSIIKKIPNFKVIISETIPHSSKKDEIIKRIHQLKVESFVEFVGFLHYELLPSYLTRADVVVQPSVNQSVNLTAREAMACGTPIIISPEGYEQTKNGEAGFLVKPTDTSLLSKKIIFCLINPLAAKNFGEKGISIVKKRFSWDSVTNELWKFIKKDTI